MFLRVISSALLDQLPFIIPMHNAPTVFIDTYPTQNLAIVKVRTVAQISFGRYRVTTTQNPLETLIVSTRAAMGNVSGVLTNGQYGNSSSFGLSGYTDASIVTRYFGTNGKSTTDNGVIESEPCEKRW